MSSCVRYLGVCIRAGTGGLTVNLGRRGTDTGGKPYGRRISPRAPRGKAPPLGEEEMAEDVVPRGLKSAAAYAFMLALIAAVAYCTSAEGVCKRGAHPGNDRRPPPGVWCPGAPGCFRRTP